MIYDGAPLRTYSTGDWAERSGGLLYFKERIDYQVKINGFRLELDEVEAVMRECGWPVVCAVKWRDSLAAVVEQIDDRQFNEADLRAKLASRIEPHGIPAVIRLISKLPRNDNDKIDRNAVLSWLEWISALRPDHFVPTFSDSIGAKRGDEENSTEIF
jgi:D-alanine--poly(phosphoribitol) ligase subunit 1